MSCVKAYKWRKPDVRGRALFDAVVTDGSQWILLIGATAADAGCRTRGPFYSESSAVKALDALWDRSPFHDVNCVDPSDFPETEQ